MPAPRFPSPTAAWAPAFAWSEILFKTAEMMMASGQVIGHRVERMGKAGASPSARDVKEFTLMGQEKLEAATESAQAMSLHWWQTQQQASAKAMEQMMGMSTAWWSLMGARTWGQASGGQSKLSNAWLDAWKGSSQWSDATTRLMNKGLLPIHARATANAKRLGSR